MGRLRRSPHCGPTARPANTGCFALLQRAAAEGVLKQLQAHQDAWQRVDVILEQSQSQQTKFLAMQVGCVAVCALGSIVSLAFGAVTCISAC